MQKYHHKSNWTTDSSHWVTHQMSLSTKMPQCIILGHALHWPCITLGYAPNDFKCRMINMLHIGPYITLVTGGGGHTHTWWRSTQPPKMQIFKCHCTSNWATHQKAMHHIEPCIILGQTLHWLPMLVRIHTPMLEYKRITMHHTGSHITLGIHHMSDVI